MKHNEKIVRIVTLENEIEARLISELLNNKGIPHALRSFYDSALDGIYQLQKGWGYIEAPERFTREIKLLVNSLRRVI